MGNADNKYQPSNGTEGMYFTDKFCDRCLNQHPDPDNKKQCMILMRTLVYSTKDKEYPEEWTYDERNEPTCTAFVKWDWGRDDDGNWKEPPPPPVDDPNQLCFPFIFDELEIKEIQSQLTNQ